jgi:hypothetical protein
VDLGWAPPTWSQEWALAGNRLAEMGTTTEMPKVEVSV